jgi:hypothetical protein
MVGMDTADDEPASLRELLARAEVLAPPGPPVAAPDPIAAADARREVGRSGVLVSDLVAEGRE